MHPATWPLAPVMTDFDPKFNVKVPEIVERGFQAFLNETAFILLESRILMNERNESMKNIGIGFM